MWTYLKLGLWGSAIGLVWLVLFFVLSKRESARFRPPHQPNRNASSPDDPINDPIESDSSRVA
jgi:hypothetical protein